jgi:hypothetical protein
MARNILNNVNLTQPTGVLDSPLSGKSNALAGDFFFSAAPLVQQIVQLRPAICEVRTAAIKSVM